VEISASGSSTPLENAPVIQLRNPADTFIHHCCAVSGTVVFLRVAGDQTRNLILNGNVLAPRMVQLEGDVPADVVHSDLSRSSS
jgi:hypothetical protein